MHTDLPLRRRGALRPPWSPWSPQPRLGQRGFLLGAASAHGTEAGEPSPRAPGFAPLAERPRPCRGPRGFVLYSPWSLACGLFCRGTEWRWGGLRRPASAWLRPEALRPTSKTRNPAGMDGSGTQIEAQTLDSGLWHFPLAPM